MASTQPRGFSQVSWHHRGAIREPPSFSWIDAPIEGWDNAPTVDGESSDPIIAIGSVQVGKARLRVGQPATARHSAVLVRQ